jgi:hypothetical protein
MSACIEAHKYEKSCFRGLQNGQTGVNSITGCFRRPIREIWNSDSENEMTLILRLATSCVIRQASINCFVIFYDPASPSYRHYLTVGEFTTRFGPTEEDHNAILHWAQSNEFTVVATSRDRVNVDVTGPVAASPWASGPRTHIGLADPAIAHRGPGQLFDPASRPGASGFGTGSCPDQSFCRSDMA